MSEEASLDEFIEEGIERGKKQERESPDNWNVYRADEIMEITRGASPRPKGDPELFGGDIPWVKIGDVDVKNTRYTGETEDTVTEKGARKSKLVDEGTLLVSNSGTCGYPMFAGRQSCVHDGWLILRDYDGSLNPHYLYEYINWKQNYLKSLAPGSTQINLNTSRFGVLEISTPPLPEQRKIATVLYTVDRAIEKVETIISRLERVHNGLFQTLIPGGIGHDQYDVVRILGRNVQIPTSWDVTTVSEACSEIIDYRGKNPKFSDEGIPHLRNINIGRGELLLDDLKYISEETYEEWMTRGFPQEGDTLLSTEAPMGKTAVLPEMKFSLSQRLIVLRPGEQFDNQFFAHLMGSPFVQKEYEARATGSTVKGISNYNLQEVTIPVPPREEQERIAERIDETLETIHINEQEFERLNRLKRGLMQDLLSGTVRTTNTNIEVPDEIAQHG